MAGCPFAIAITPAMAIIGMRAPMILLLARPGFANGGEYRTSVSWTGPLLTER
jgi:MFS transporter, MHS family, alpha-ketoglutarate permease